MSGHEPLPRRRRSLNGEGFFGNATGSPWFNLAVIGVAINTVRQRCLKNASVHGRSVGPGVFVLAPPCACRRSMLSQTRTRLFQVARHLSTRPARSSIISRTMSSSSASSSSESQPQQPPVQLPSLNFEVSPVPKNPLGEGRWIKTAACLIIGCVVFFLARFIAVLMTELNHGSDEILNGKTHDKNSNYFAKFCFEQGVEL